MSAAELRMYRAVLSLCPARFRRDHGEEMARDFDEARREAAAAGRRALWLLRLLMAVDLVRTVAIQWSRSALLPIAAAAIVFTVAIAEGLAALALAGRSAIRAPIDPKHEEELAVLFLAVIAVMLIAITIVLTQWVSRPIRRGRR